MKYLLVLVSLIFIIFTGCSNDLQENNDNNSSNSGGDSGSYAALLKVNGVQYTSLGNVNKDKYTINEKIGKVDKKVPVDVLPFKDFMSNYLEEGTPIFSIEENTDVVLAKREDETYEILRYNN
ncbi:hypothetical protein SAMN05421676_107164 [Salinibacillus kushneri]|uniref:Lipoprotein n=1 Tax=Salinibacillus kushneri TaxID=237682 RepID=A0A1I0GTG1_9BACI|nr:hypothetical protein [Salinibacillus kushneri]SET74641.1 hypothetical protein SAMN05421676_107164 [Salinibacillus kushneri]